MATRKDVLKSYIETWEDSGELSPTQFVRFVKIAKEELQAWWWIELEILNEDEELPNEVQEAYERYCNNRHVDD